MRRYIWIAVAVAVGLVAYYVGRETPLNLIIITLDTTRADHLGCYGFGDIQTPNLDRLAQQGVRFDRAFSAIPLTAPSHCTVFTGRYPFNHGVRDNGTFVLSSSQLTLAEILSGRGYATGAAVGAFPLASTFGLRQGFDFYDEGFMPEDSADASHGLFFAHRSAGDVNEAILPWIDAQRGQPFFAWIHYYDAHHPLDPPAPYNQLYADNPYAGEIAYMDEAIGVVLELLEETGQLEHTVIAVLADHGEGKGEHEEESHSHLLYNSTLHVPWIIWQGNQKRSRVIEEWVSLVDVMPTLLGLLDVDLNAAVDGMSLVVAMDGEGDVESDRMLYAETLAPRLNHGWGELRSVYQRPWKYIHGPRPELYDIENDLSELNNIVSSGPTATLLRNLEQILETWPEPDLEVVVNSNRRDLELMQSLGYVSVSGNTRIAETLTTEGFAPQDFAADVSRWSVARQLLFNGKARSAKQYVTPLLEKDPNSRIYLELMAAVQLQLAHRDEAEGLFGKLVEHYPLSSLNPAIPKGIGSLYLDNGNVKQALRFFDISFQIEPNVELLYGIASLLRVSGDEAAYRATLKQCVELDSSHFQSALELGIEQAKSGDFAAADRLFRQVTTLNPLNAKGWYNLGALSINRQQERDAMVYLEKAIALDEDYTQAYLAAITAQLNLGQHDRAQLIYERLKLVVPMHPDIARAKQLMEP